MLILKGAMWAVLEAEDSIWSKREEQACEVGAKVHVFDNN